MTKQDPPEGQLPRLVNEVGAPIWTHLLPYNRRNGRLGDFVASCLRRPHLEARADPAPVGCCPSHERALRSYPIEDDAREPFVREGYGEVPVEPNRS